MVLGKSMF